MYVPARDARAYTVDLGYNLDVALSEYLLNQTNFTHPYNASNESNPVFFVPSDSGTGYVNQFGNYSWDDTMYRIIGTNKTGVGNPAYTAGIKYIQTNVRTVEFDMLFYQTDVSVGIVLKSSSSSSANRAIRIVWLPNETLYISGWYMTISEPIYFHNFTGDQWNHFVISWEEPIANIPFRCNFWIANYSASVNFTTTTDVLTDDFRITVGSFAGDDDIKLAKIDNIALYSKYIEDLEETVQAASVAFEAVNKIIISMLPLFLIVGLIGVLGKTISRAKFKKA